MRVILRLCRRILFVYIAGSFANVRKKENRPAYLWVKMAFYTYRNINNSKNNISIILIFGSCIGEIMEFFWLFRWFWLIIDTIQRFYQSNFKESHAFRRKLPLKNFLRVKFENHSPCLRTSKWMYKRLGVFSSSHGGVCISVAEML